MKKPWDAKIFEKYPNGTILRYRRKLYCLQHGLEGRIVVDVESGCWFFTRELKWRTFHVEFQPGGNDATRTSTRS